MEEIKSIILFSIHGDMVGHILRKEKLAELRKANLETPFVGLIYCTKEQPCYYEYNGNTYNAAGNVVASFICRNKQELEYLYADYDPSVQPALKRLCLEPYMVEEYAKNKRVYMYDIEDLNVFAPAPLSAFYRKCSTSCVNCKNPKYYEKLCEEQGVCRLDKAPQSYTYVLNATSYKIF